MQNKPITIPQPNITKNHLTEVGNASTQTVDEITTEKMDIEVKERLLKKEIFYTKLYFVKKAHKEEMEVEGERVKKTRKQYKPKAVKTKTKWYKTYVTKK